MYENLYTVCISCGIKVHAWLALANEHFSPDGQCISWMTLISYYRFIAERTCEFHWRLMLFREHGKQNLWPLMDGHCTKWVSSNRSWQLVHRSVCWTVPCCCAATAAAACWAAAAIASVVPLAVPNCWKRECRRRCSCCAKTPPFWFSDCSGLFVEVGEMEVVWASPNYLQIT